VKKFKYLLLAFGFMLCMIPNVNAASTSSINIDASTFYIFNGDNGTNSSTRETLEASNWWSTQGVNYYSAVSTSTSRYATAYSVSGLNSLEKNKKYSIAFWLYDEYLPYMIFDENGAISDSTYFYHSANYNMPLVIVQDNYCSVKPYGVGSNNYTNTFEYASTYYVVCSNFSAPNGVLNIYEYGVTSTSNTGNHRMGISSTFYYWSEDEQINAIIDGQLETNNQLNDLNDNITSSDTSNSQNQANSFFEGFESDDYGLSDIVTMPLELIKGLTSDTCVALSLTLPFVNKTFELPCMSSIYQEHFGSFFTLYQTVTFGFVSYWVIVKIFALVKGFKDPDDDKVEVMDL